MNFQAVIFDLDGVLTDTAELHYRAWKQLAEQEGFTFNRDMNEQLRGVSRRQSLKIILDGKPVSEAQLQEMMARKNEHYVAMLDQITPTDLLPGVVALLDQLEEANIPYAVASASKNAPNVCQRLGIASRLAALADGNSVPRPKPYPDLFRYAAAQMNKPASQCLVVEDASAGIRAALDAGMPALALGPKERFAEVNGRFNHRPDLSQITLDELDQLTAFDPRWYIVQEEFDPNTQHHMETVFTLGNGYFSSRGTFEEGYPNDIPITFAHGVFDDMPISFTELANLPDWLDLTVTIDQDPFKLDSGQLLHFQRDMNLQQGILRRNVRWQAPNGKIVDLHFERFASYAQEHVGGIRVLATAVSHPCTITIHAGLNGHVSNEDLLHWRILEQGQDSNGSIWLHTRTRHSNIELGIAAAIQSNADTLPNGQSCPGHPRLMVSQTLPIGQTLQVDKLICLYTSRDDVPNGVVSHARQALNAWNYNAVRQAHIQAWHTLWQACDVVIEGDDEAQVALRFSLFQLLVAAPQNDERVSIGAKTMSGYGYRGHVFWDTEIFILPFFTYALPHIAKNLLMYRYHTLEGARRKAKGNGFSGAQYPWESANTGDEVTPTWVPHFEDPTQLVRIWTGDIEVHISADVAYGMMQYWQTTGDDAFMRDYGAEIILDTARFWGDRAEYEETAVGYQYALRDVIGPDEYHDHVDNNTFTNRMAQWHLQQAFAVLDWLKQNYPDRANKLTNQLNLTDTVLAHWQDVIEHIIIHHDRETGLMLQFDDFFERIPVDPEFIAQADTSLQIIFGIDGANERQVLKQADVVMLLCLLRDEYDQKTWQTNWDTYMPLTDHRYGSSLGPSFHAWAACEMNRPEEAYDHFMRAARADLRNIRGNANEGIHAASAGGIWQAVVFGFAGLRLTEDGYTVTPRLPAHWERLTFKFYHKGQQQIVDLINMHKNKEVMA